MVYKRFVEIGRVCVINYGPDSGKLCVLNDVIDQNRAFVDGPASITGVFRQAIPFRRLALTDIKVKIPRNARPGTLVKIFEKEGVLAKWQQTSWFKKQDRKVKRASLGDFDRFKVMLARKTRSRIVNAEVKKLAKVDRKRRYLKPPKKCSY